MPPDLIMLLKLPSRAAGLENDPKHVDGFKRSRYRRMGSAEGCQSRKYGAGEHARKKTRLYTTKFPIRWS